MEQTELSKYEKLKITVTNPEKKTEGFFSKTYVTYKISTSPASFVVHRRYTDFTWLRNTLLNLCLRPRKILNFFVYVYSSK